MTRLGKGISLVAAACTALVGCNESSTSTVTSSSTPTTSTSSPQAAAAVDAASSAFQALFQSGNQPSASNVLGGQTAQIQSANVQLQSAVRANPNDSKAAFGLAVTSLALRMDNMSGTLSSMQDNGLGLNASGRTFSGTPADVNAAVPVLARSMATASKAPLVSDFQDSLEIRLLPTVDSVANLLNVAWNDASFELKVYDKEGGDTLVIDRGDVGLALAIVKAVQAEINWMISYNVNIDVNGSYEWLDTLANIGKGAVDYPTTSAQQSSYRQLQTFLTPGSSFLKVRVGKEARLASVLTGLRSAITLAKEATNVSYQVKNGKTNRLIQSITTAKQRNDVLAALDSAGLWLSGPRTITVTSWNKCQEVVRSTSTYGGAYSRIDTTKYLSMFGTNECPEGYSYSSSSVSYSYSSSQTYTKISGTSNAVSFDLSKLITLSDLKLFLPSSYAWNNTFDATWSSTGPILWTNGTAKVSMDSVMSLAQAAKSYVPFKSWITWSDPTIGGVFPGMTQGGLFDMVFKGSEIDPTTKATPKLGVALGLLP
jgi:hypothetical protein